MKKVYQSIVKYRSKTIRMSNVIDLYIEKFPLQTQEVLNEMRNIILEVIPNAEQVIGYQT